MGAQREQNLKKLKWHKRIIRAILFKKKYDSLQDILRQTKLNTVFELFILDVFREIFNQLRSNWYNEVFKTGCWNETSKNERIEKRYLANTL